MWYVKRGQWYFLRWTDGAIHSVVHADQARIYHDIGQAALDADRLGPDWEVTTAGEASKLMLGCEDVTEGFADTRNPKDQAADARCPLHLLPAIGRIYGAEACRDGARKYGPYNWRQKPISLLGYTGAIERHLLALRDGEWLDKSGVPHLGHIIATASILLDARAAGTLKEDCPLLGSAADVLQRLEETRDES